MLFTLNKKSNILSFYIHKHGALSATSTGIRLSTYTQLSQPRTHLFLIKSTFIVSYILNFQFLVFYCKNACKFQRQSQSSIIRFRREKEKKILCTPLNQKFCRETSSKFQQKSEQSEILLCLFIKFFKAYKNIPLAPTR